MIDDDYDYEYDEEEDLGPSKSEIKREMLALQALGERLVGMGPKEWPKFPLTPELADALDESRRIKSHVAMRRHIRRVGKLLRQADLVGIQALFEQIDNRHLADNRRFHSLERWRTRLVEEGDSAVEELIQECPFADRQHLRQLIRQAQKEQAEDRPQAASRKIFKYLRDLDFG